jgi:predicted MFS family arabinose efflux permease
LFYLMNGVATLIASTAAGVLWHRFGPAATFGFGSAIAALAILVIPTALPWRETRRDAEQHQNDRELRTGANH